MSLAKKGSFPPGLSTVLKNNHLQLAKLMSFSAHQANY